jgi:hypothetical protein
MVNVMCVDLDALAFIFHFASQFCIASKFVCSLRDAMAGSLSVAITAVSSAKVPDVVCGDVGRSAANSTLDEVMTQGHCLGVLLH